jgi:hypothetical protein
MPEEGRKTNKKKLTSVESVKNIISGKPLI